MYQVLILLALSPFGARAAGVLTKIVPERATAVAPLVARAAELLRERAPVVLMGAPGETARAVARGLANDAEVYALDVGALLAEVKFRGEIEERLETTLARFTDEPGRVLFVEDPTAILNERELATRLTALVAAGRIKMVTVLTPSQFSGYAEVLPTFTDRVALLDLPRAPLVGAARFTAGADLPVGRSAGGAGVKPEDRPPEMRRPKFR